MFHYLDSQGLPAHAPTEWTTGFIVLEVPQDAWSYLMLHINGRPRDLSLRILDGKPRVVAEWERSGPGGYRLDLTGAIESSTVWTITSSKITPAAMASMLDDLARTLPASIAISLQRMGGFTGLEIVPPSALTRQEEFERLRRAVLGTWHRRGLAALLPAINRDPHHMLRSEQRWVPSHRVRRPATGQLVAAMTRAGNLQQDRSLLQMATITSRPTVDVYENQVVRLFWQIVQRRLRTLRHQASGDLREACDTLTVTLETARRRAGFLANVADLTHPPQQVSMVLMRRPEYRDILEGYLELQRSLTVRLESDLLESPLANLPQLYQLWGLLQVVDTVLDVAAHHGWTLRRQQFLHHPPGDLFVRILPNGQPIVELAHSDGRRLNITPEPSFGKTGEVYSISYTQRPDIVVDCRYPDGSRRLVILDPKYKLDGTFEIEADTGSKPKKPDIDAMHAYRDAIRDQYGNRVVTHAATLYPGPTRWFGDGIAGLRAVPGHGIDTLRTDVRAMIMHLIEPDLPA